MSIPPVKSLLDFSNRVVLVTGAGSGWDRALPPLAEAGARVIVHFHSAGKCAVGGAPDYDAGGQAIALQADLTEARLSPP